MSGFDLDNLLEYDPPSHLCEKCFAINTPTLTPAAEQAQDPGNRLDDYAP